MEVITYKCPNCGGDLTFDPASGKYKCEYCLSSFTQEEAERANPKAAEALNGEDDAAGAQEASDAQKESSTEETKGETEQGEAVVYTCPNCGAEIVTDATTAATYCFYCHNPVVLSGRLSGEYMPDFVLPFKISKEQAIEKFLSFARKKRFIPKDFFEKNQVQKMTGVYFPYWIYGGDFETDYMAHGRKVRVWQTGDVEYKETSIYDVRREGEVRVDGLSRNALNKADRDLIECVQPYRLEEMQPFSMGYLSGFQAEKRDICALVGIEGFEIGDTICDYENPEALPPIAIDEPTMSMLFTINDSPFFGKEGKFVTSRHIHDRLMKELDKNLALRVRKSEEDGKWVVSGRGVLHLSVLIETMRREGYELQVGQPQVIFKEIDGVKNEPIEELTVNVPEEYASKIIDMVTRRKGEMVKMESAGERVNLEFNMPSRGIIGLRTNVLTASAGEAIMAHRFKEYQPYKGEIERRTNGSIIAMEAGTAFSYALNNLQSRGRFFISPQEDVYAGQVVGEHTKEGDLVVNVTKSKKLTNMRASGSDDKVSLAPPIVFSLEDALEYIKADEYVEITPNYMRMRKIILDETERKRQGR